MKDKQSSLASICMITYNHENYIRQAIEGVLIQKCSFSYELIIGDDFSKDKTRLICEEYAFNYPNIMVLPSKRNKGVSVNFLSTLSACNAKYIALCEGDDYWTDPNKLQKQVDFMEANPKYSITSHRYKILDEENQKLSLDFAHELFTDRIEGLNYNINTFLDNQYTQTMTVVFRKSALDLSQLKRYKNAGDMLVFYHVLKNGLGYCFNYDAAVYRKHIGGVYALKDSSFKFRHGYYIFRNWYFVSKDEVFSQKYYIHKDLMYNDIINSIALNKKRANKFQDIISIIKDDLKLTGYKTALCTIRNILRAYYKSLKS
jgi:glycosyltransferase involved in cell wall biosynthesis